MKDERENKIIELRQQEDEIRRQIHAILEEKRDNAIYKDTKEDENGASVRNLFAYIFGAVFFVMSALMLLSVSISIFTEDGIGALNSFKFLLFFSLNAVIFFPPLYKPLAKKSGIKISTFLKIIIFILSVIVCAVSVNS